MRGRVPVGAGFNGQACSGLCLNSVNLPSFRGSWEGWREHVRTSAPAPARRASLSSVSPEPGTATACGSPQDLASRVRGTWGWTRPPGSPGTVPLASQRHRLCEGLRSSCWRAVQRALAFLARATIPAAGNAHGAPRHKNRGGGVTLSCISYNVEEGQRSDRL